MDTMKVDAALIKQLREARAWPQDHLATLTGLSLRTIQRVEADGSASAETRMALAAAFGLRVDELQPTQAAAAAQPAGDTGAGAEAGAEVGTTPPPAAWPTVDAGPLPLTSTQYRWLRFAVIGGLLLTLDISSSGHVTWSRWVLIFWAVGLLLRRLRPAAMARNRRARG